MICVYDNFSPKRISMQFLVGNRITNSSRSMLVLLASASVSALLRKRTGLPSWVSTAPIPFKEASVSMMLPCLGHSGLAMCYVVLDDVHFLLHITGPYKMAVAFQQQTHEMGLLGQIGDECGHKVHSSQQTL